MAKNNKFKCVLAAMLASLVTISSGAATVAFAAEGTEPALVEGTPSGEGTDNGFSNPDETPEPTEPTEPTDSENPELTEPTDPEPTLPDDSEGSEGDGGDITPPADDNAPADDTASPDGTAKQETAPAKTTGKKKTALKSVDPRIWVSSVDGICGKSGSDSVQWVLDLNTGVLTISGTGAMADYEYTGNQPWEEYQNNIQSVVIEEGVTTIGNNAFRDCSNMTSITIPTSVTSIGNSAFQGCSNLTEIDIPASVTTIGEYAFYICHSLTEVTIPASVTTIDDGTFAYCTSLKEITIPDSVTTIDFCAFSDCSSLKEITIPASVTTIDDRTFASCTSLKEITIPSSVTTIGDEAFDGCTDLTTVNAPCSWNTADPLYPFGSTVEVHVAAHTFDANSKCTACGCIGGDCSANDGVSQVAWEFDEKTGTLIISGTGVMADYGENTQPWAAYMSNIESVVIGEGVTTIGKYAFYGCEKLASVTFSADSKLEDIGAYAFYQSGLTSIKIPASVETIGEQAFAFCAKLITVTFAADSNLKAIDDYAFYGTALKLIEIPESVEEIDWYAFYNCRNLTTVTMAGEAPTLGSGVFIDCTSLTAIKVPLRHLNVYKTATDWSAYAGKMVPYGTDGGDCSANDGVSQVAWEFDIETGTLTISGTGAMADYSGSTQPWAAYKRNIESVVIGEGVTTIGKYAFHFCSNMTSITIPTGVTSIGNYAFSECWGLKKVTIPTGVTSIGDGVFIYCNSLKEVNIPTGVTSIGYDVFVFCSSLEEITVPASVQTIGSNAFSECQNLTTVTMAGEAPTLDSNAFYDCTSLKAICVKGTYLDDYLTDSTWAPYKEKIVAYDNLNYADVTFDQEEYEWTGKEIKPAVTVTDAAGNKLTEGTDYEVTYSDNKAYGTGKVIITAKEGGNYTGKKEVTFELTAGEGYTAYGTCGKNAYWKLSDGGEMTIFGTGAMADYGNYTQPWAAYKSNIQSVVVEEGITAIGKYAFYKCEKLTAVTFAENSNLKTIGRYAFSECQNLTDVTFAENSNLTMIEMGAFDTSGLTSVKIPASVRTIDFFAFYNCSKLTKVTFEKDSKLEIIEGMAFVNSGLTSIEIPASVQMIDEIAFDNCSNLTTVTMAGTAPTLDSNAFNECTSLKAICVKGAYLNDYLTDSTWAPYKDLIVAPDSLNYADVTFDQEEYEWTGEEIKPAVTVTDAAGNTLTEGTDYEVTYSDNNVYGTGKVTITAKKDGNYTGKKEVTFELTAGEGYIDYGTCGANAYWKLSNDGKMTIFGTGAMANYTHNIPPWEEHKSNIKSVVIEEEITSIGNNVFWECENLAAVTFAENSKLKTIGILAFSETGLTSIKIPASVETIESNAFDSTGLTSIEIPASVETIGGGAFLDCNKLAAVTFAEDSKLTTIEDNAFSSTDLTSIEIPASVETIGGNAFSNCNKLADVTFAEDSMLKTIGESAFEATDLTSIEIPASVKSIDGYALYNCIKLTKITMEGAAPTLGEETFEICDKLTTIFVKGAHLESYRTDSTWAPYKDLIVAPDSLEFAVITGVENSYTWTGDAVEPKVTVVTDALGNKVDANEYEVTYSSNDAYGTGKVIITAKEGGNYTGQKEVTFELTAGEGYTAYGKCGENAYWKLSDGGELTIFGTGAMEDYGYGHDDGVYYNQPWAAYMSDIKSVEIAEGITSIGKYAFSWAALASIEIPASVETIGECAFYTCENLAAVMFAENSKLTTIGDSAFAYTSLATIAIPASVKTIDYAAFEWCSDLATVTFTENSNLQTIGSYAFSNTGLTVITIPASVKTIGAAAFNNCKNLAAVTFKADSNLTTIGEYAFNGCKALTEIIIPAKVASLSRYTFAHCTALKKVTFAEGSALQSIAERAFLDTGITSITIPSGVIEIDDSAFEQCHDLTEVTMEGAAPALGKDVFLAGMYGVPSEKIIKLEKIFVKAAHYAGYMANETWAEYADLIIAPDSLKFADVTLDKEIYTWTGQEIKPTVTVTDALGEPLSDTNHYTVTYGENTAVGEGTVTITAKDGSGYVGSQTVNFTIAKPSGECGEQAKWEFDPDNSKLSITGTGDMTDYAFDVDENNYLRNGTPWSSYVEYIQDVEIAAGITSIGACTFTYCKNLKSVTIADGVTKIGNSAFNATGLTSVTIPSSVKTIGFSAFNECKSLTVINLNEGLERIEHFALTSTNLAELTIPDSVTYLGRNLFNHNSSITALRMTGDAPEADEHLFLGAPNDLTVYVYGTDASGYEGGAWDDVTVVYVDQLTSVDAITDLMTYTDEAKTPTVTVRNYRDEVIDPSNYNVAYLDNVNAGQATVVITGTGAVYGGELRTTFNIQKKAATVTAEDQTITYGESLSGAASDSGLITGHTASVTVTPSTTKVTVNGVLTVSDVVIKSGDTDVTANYEITCVPGKLVINPDLSGIAGLTEENVTSADEDAVNAVLEMMDGSDAETLQQWDSVIDNCNGLLEKIGETQAEKGRIEEALGEYHESTVTSDDEEALKKLAEDIKTQLDTDNLTEEERTALEEAQSNVETLLGKIGETQAEKNRIEEEISKYDENTVTSDDEEALKKLAEDINAQLGTDNLTDEERAALEGAKSEVESILQKIENVADATKNLLDAVEDYDKETVKSTDKTGLETLLKDIETQLDTDNLTDEERAALEDAQKQVEDLLEKIDESLNDVLTDSVVKADEITEETVKPEDKEVLENAKSDLEQALTENENNYTEDEKQAIREEIARIDDVLDSLDRVENAEDLISALPETAEPDDETAIRHIMDAKNAYDALTEHEKSLLDEGYVQKLEALLSDITQYELIEGVSSSWVTGSKMDLVFVANGAFSKFVGIEVDGKAVHADHYDAEAGSTRIELEAAYLETLAPGKHTIAVLYTDGVVTGTFTVVASYDNGTNNPDAPNNPDHLNNPGDSDSPETGDDNGLLSLLITLTASSAAAAASIFAVLTAIRRKRRADR